MMSKQQLKKWEEVVHTHNYRNVPCGSGNAKEHKQANTKTAKISSIFNSILFASYECNEMHGDQGTLESNPYLWKRKQITSFSHKYTYK